MESLIEKGVTIIDQKEIQNYGQQSIGILLFQGIGDDYFGYGLTSDLINDFDSINEIYVSDIQDSMKFQLSDHSISDIGRKIQVDNILEGSYLIKKEKIELSLRMLNISTGNTIFKETIIDKTNNINSIRARIVNKILDIFEVRVPDFILDKIAIDMTRPIIAKEKSFKINFPVLNIEFVPLFLIVIPNSRPPSRPIKTQVVLIGTSL